MIKCIIQIINELIIYAQYSRRKAYIRSQPLPQLTRGCSVTRIKPMLSACYLFLRESRVRMRVISLFKRKGKRRIGIQKGGEMEKGIDKSRTTTKLC